MSRLGENSATKDIPLIGYLIALGAPISWASANVIARILVTDQEMNVPPLVASSFSMSFGLLIFIIDTLQDSIFTWQNITVPGESWYQFNFVKVNTEYD